MQGQSVHSTVLSKRREHSMSKPTQSSDSSFHEQLREGSRSVSRRVARKLHSKKFLEGISLPT